jgi:hypothetical protein
MSGLLTQVYHQEKLLHRSHSLAHACSSLAPHGPLAEGDLAQEERGEEADRDKERPGEESPGNGLRQAGPDRHHGLPEEVDTRRPESREPLAHARCRIGREEQLRIVQLRELSRGDALPERR